MELYIYDYDLVDILAIESINLNFEKTFFIWLLT